MECLSDMHFEGALTDSDAETVASN